MGARREYEKILALFIRRLRSMDDKRALEPGQKEAMIAATRRLVHALRIKDLRKVEAAVNELARTFLRD